MEQVDGIPAEICQCGYGSVLQLIAKTARNQGCPFLRYPNLTPTTGSTRQVCDYFEWLDWYKERKLKESRLYNIGSPTIGQCTSSRTLDASYGEESSRLTCPSCIESTVELRHYMARLQEAHDGCRRHCTMRLEEANNEIKFLRAIVLILLVIYLTHLTYLSS